MDATPAQYQFLELVYDQQKTGTIASGTINNIAQEASSDLTLLRNQVAEIKFIEATSPLSAAGAGQALEYIRPFIDGQDYQGGALLRMRADLDSNVVVPRALYNGDMRGFEYAPRTFFEIGDTLEELVAQRIDAKPAQILNNTTIKVREAGTIDFKYEVGNSALTGNWRVRAWGAKYLDLSIADRLVQLVYGGGRHIDLVDKRAGRKFQTNVNATYGTAKNDWNKLIGGNDMRLHNGVDIRRFNYWARNKGATTASVEFPLSFTPATNVNKLEQNMDIQVPDDTLWWVDRLGLKYGTNHKDLFVKVNQRYIFHERVSDTSTGGGYNNLDFGRITNTSAAATFTSHLFKPIPNIVPIAASNEELQVVIKDNGTAIADGTNFGNGDLVVWSGFVIKDPLFQGNTPRLY